MTAHFRRASLVIGNFYDFCPFLAFEARKLAEFFHFHRVIRPFYAACRFYELSRGSVLCLFDASFGKWFPQRHNSIFYAEIDDHGIHRGNMGWILAQWRHPVASRVALDLPYWAMCSALYRLIRMAIEMARKASHFFLSSIYVFHNRS